MQPTKKQENQPVELGNILEGYSEKWVVLSTDYSKVLKSADDIKGLSEFYDKGVIMFVVNQSYSYAP